MKNAKVPEHIPALMAGISQADLFLVDSFLCLAKDDWLIVVGYPLEREFSAEAFAGALEKARGRVRPFRIWFIAPEIPPSLAPKTQARETDYYYRLGLGNLRFDSRLIRAVEKAAQDLKVDSSRNFSEEHNSLTEEFLKRQELPARVHQLYLRMKDYLSFSGTCLLLSAWDRGIGDVQE